jgi:hypothetical protein
VVNSLRSDFTRPINGHDRWLGSPQNAGQVDMDVQMSESDILPGFLGVLFTVIIFFLSLLLFIIITTLLFLLSSFFFLLLSSSSLFQTT